MKRIDQMVASGEYDHAPNLKDIRLWVAEISHITDRQIKAIEDISDGGSGPKYVNGRYVQ